MYCRIKLFLRVLPFFECILLFSNTSCISAIFFFKNITTVYKFTKLKWLNFPSRSEFKAVESYIQSYFDIYRVIELRVISTLLNYDLVYTTWLYAQRKSCIDAWEKFSENFFLITFFWIFQAPQERGWRNDWRSKMLFRIFGPHCSDFTAWSFGFGLVLDRSLPFWWKGNMGSICMERQSRIGVQFTSSPDDHRIHLFLRTMYVQMLRNFLKIF